MDRCNRRQFLRAVGPAVAVAAAGCSGGGGTPDSPPFADRIVFVSGDNRAPLSNPWFYKARFTDGDPIEGLERPVWVCVFADRKDYEETPPEDQPHRNFEIREGQVEPLVGTEPTNDAYIVLKDRDGTATLLFVAKQASLNHEILFDDEQLFNTGQADPGTTFELPP